MKVCVRCKESKELDEFWASQKALDKKRSYCKSCDREVIGLHRLLNPEMRREETRRGHIKSSEKAKLFIYNFKESNPCTDCGEYYPYYVMDFDHLRDKKYSVSKMLHFSIERILEEILKCELVCANCHRERTYGRKDG